MNYVLLIVLILCVIVSLYRPYLIAVLYLSIYILFPTIVKVNIIFFDLSIVTAFLIAVIPSFVIKKYYPKYKNTLYTQTFLYILFYYCIVRFLFIPFATQLSIFEQLKYNFNLVYIFSIVLISWFTMIHTL